MQQVLWSAPCLHKPRYTPSHIEGHRWGPSQARSWHPGSKAPLPEPFVIFTYQVGWNSTTYPQAGIIFQLANELVSTSSLTCSLPWSHVKRHIGMLWHAVSVQLLKHLKIVHESGQLGEAKPKTWSPQRLPAPSRRCHNRTCCCALNVALRYCGLKRVWKTWVNWGWTWKFRLVVYYSRT